MDVLDAWKAYCLRLAAMADELRGAPYPDDPLAQAEGVRYLARMTALGLLQATDGDDPAFPVLQRLNDDIVKWAGPNVDNIYLGAAVRHPHVYRLHGNVERSGGFILQTLTGWWGEARFAIHDDRSSDAFAIDGDGTVTITIGGPDPANDLPPGGPTSRNWMPLHPDADRLFVREYAIDWRHHRRCDFVLERLDPEPLHQPVLDTASVDRMLDTAAHWVEHTVPFWNAFETGMRTALEPNTFGAPFTTPGGGADIWYGNGRIDLDGDDVLLVELPVPDARYWSVQLYNEHWYESLDFGSRCTSRNHTQVHVDADGVARLVVAGRDPGVPNWLDLAGHRRAFAHFRAVWCTRAFAPRTTVLAFDELRDRLPAEHPVVTPAQRRAELEQRRVDVAARHRR